MRHSFRVSTKSGETFIIDWYDEEYHDMRDKVVERMSTGQITGDEVKQIHLMMFYASAKAGLNKIPTVKK